MFLNYALHRLALLGYILSSAPSEPNRITLYVSVIDPNVTMQHAPAYYAKFFPRAAGSFLSLKVHTHTHTKDLRSCGCHLEAMGTRAVLRLLLGEERLPRMLVALASVTWTEKGKEKKVMTRGERGLV